MHGEGEGIETKPGDQAAFGSIRSVNNGPASDWNLLALTVRRGPCAALQSAAERVVAGGPPRNWRTGTGKN